MPDLVVAGTRHALDREAILGRHRDCAVRILDAAASRQHARVFQRDGGWWVEDLGSANGTRLDGVPLTARRPLADGSVITIGAHEIRFAGPAAGGASSGIQGAEPVLGRTIAGYRIDRLLGKGPTGAVYVARQLNLERDVAFKVVAAPIAGRPGFTDTFLKGMGRAASLVDDGFVRVHECGSDDGRLWYSMELVAGENLDQMIARDGTIDPDLAADTTARVAAALAGAHAKGLYHHDLRPAVALVTPQGRVKVCDVGLAAVFGRGQVSAGMPVSGAWYMAPEQARGGPCDARTDIYQLGAVLWHALTGQPPFQGVTAREVAQAHLDEDPDPEELDQVGRALRETVVAMLAKDPGRRPQSMAEVAQRLDAARQGAIAGRRDRTLVAQENARRAQARAEAREFRARRRLVLGGAIVSVALVSGALAARFLLAGPVDAPPAAPAAPATGGASPSAPAAVAPPPGTPAAPSAATPDPRWAAVQAQIDRNTARGEWGAAELALRRFRAQGVGDDLRRLADLAEARLAVDGADWFRRQVAAMPSAGTAAQLAARLKATTLLRDRAPAAQRAEAEALHQEGLALLAQRLQSARREARKALEADRFADLPQIAAGIAPSFAGTPLADLHRRFAAECAEAARLHRGWQPWAATATGARAVAAGAGYLVLGVPARARTILARVGDDPVALARRQALTGGTAVLARFDDPADLASVDTPLGDVEMRDGALTGAVGAPAAVAVPIPSGDLDATLVLEAVAAGAEPVAVVSCDDWLVIELAGPRPRIRLGQGLRQEVLLAPAAAGALRIRRQAGAVTVYLGGQVMAEGPVPAGAGTLRLDVVGVRWRLDELQVFGGP